MEPVSEGLSCKFKNMAIVCAILVILIHTAPGGLEPGEPLWVFCKLIPGGIAKVGVPFFFLASGYFLAGHIGEDGWWKRELGKRVRTLLVPFILWNAIFILYGMSIASIADLLAHRAFGTSFAYVKDPFYLMLGFYPLKGPPVIATWYIRTLLLLVLISPTLVWMLKRFPRVLILGAWVLSILAFPEKGYAPSTRFLFSPEGVAYFSLGIFLRWHPIHVEGRKLWVWSVVFTVVLLAVRLVQEYTGAFRDAPLGTFSIPFMLYAVWRIIPEKRWAKGFTALAFPCFVMHIIVLRVFYFVIFEFVKIGGHSQEVQKVLELWIPLLFTVPVTLLLGYALHRCFPRVAGVLFGGR